MMPNMNDLELADRVLEFDSEPPVLFMSGDIWSADRGFGCVAKPFRPDQLVERVRRVLKANTPVERRVPAA